MTNYIMVGEAAYEIDTRNGRNEAQDALAHAGLTEADVWVGEPDGAGDSYRNGQKFFVQEAP